MVENILAVGAEGEAIFVRRTHTRAHRSALVSAQSLPPKPTAGSATPASDLPSSRRSAFACSAGAKSECLADAQIKAHVTGSGAEVVRNNLFARAGCAGERVRIKTAIWCGDCPRLVAAGGECGARVELVIPSQIRPGCDVVRSTGVGGEER